MCMYRLFYPFHTINSRTRTNLATIVYRAIKYNNISNVFIMVITCVLQSMDQPG